MDDDVDKRKRYWAMVATAKQQVEREKNNNKLVAKIGVWSGNVSPIYYNGWREIEW